MHEYTIAKYLIKRLEEIGVRHIFAVPGDYVLRFLDELELSKIKVVGTCNELNAGYAADAYARINGVSAVCVTYGVGGFSLLNAAVGAFAERVPMIILSGAPKSAEYKKHYLLHHTIEDMNLQFNVYEKITVASAELLSPEQAPRQIDEAIVSCLRWRRPVYLEIPVDMVNKPCSAPSTFSIDTNIYSDKEILTEAIDEAAAILSQAKNPVIIAGVEAHRLGCRKELEDFINHSGYPFACTMHGKTVIPEKHPQFLGIYCGMLCREYVRNIVESADIILCLGTLMTDFDFGIGTARLNISKMINANSDKVSIRHHIYEHVSLKDFLSGLQQKLPKGIFHSDKFEHPSKLLRKDYTAETDKKITLKRFYARINLFLEKEHVIIGDAGDSIFWAGELYLPEGVEYIGQMFYLSIGYSIPATLGTKLAAIDRRPIVFVGDGAFQMTAQELSTVIRQKLNPIIFLINNDGYTIERAIYDGEYNNIQMWKYHRLPEVFGGGWGAQVKTEGELENALEKAKNNHDSVSLIEICVDKLDCSEAIQKLGQALRK